MKETLGEVVEFAVAAEAVLEGVGLFERHAGRSQRLPLGQARHDFQDAARVGLDVRDDDAVENRTSLIVRGADLAEGGEEHLRELLAEELLEQRRNRTWRGERAHVSKSLVGQVQPQCRAGPVRPGEELFEVFVHLRERAHWLIGQRRIIRERNELRIEERGDLAGFLFVGVAWRLRRVQDAGGSAPGSGELAREERLR